MHKLTIWCLLSVGLSSCSSETDLTSTANANRAVTTSEIDIAHIELQNDIRYEWSVRTNSENGQGQWSEAQEFSVKTSEEEAIAESSAEAIKSEYVPSIFDDGIIAVPGVEALSPIGPVVGSETVFSWSSVDVAVSYDIRIIESDSGQTTYTENYDANALCGSGVCELESSSSPESSRTQYAESTIPTTSTDESAVIIKAQSIASLSVSNLVSQPELAAAQAAAEQAAEQSLAAQAAAQAAAEQAATAQTAAEQASAVQEAAAQAAEQASAEQAAAAQVAAEQATEQAETAQSAAEQAAAEQAAAEQTAAERAATAQAAAEQAAAEQAAAEQAAAEQAAAEQAAAEQAAQEQEAAEQVSANTSAINTEIEALQASEGVLAFPGAIGYAKNAIGGRSGRIVTVNTVENIVNPNDEFMSLREALTVESGPRTIVFSVGGIFDMGSERIYLLGEDDSYMTVACQTAPSPGVVMKTWGIAAGQKAHDIIFRHCVIRGDDELGPGQSQAGRSLTVPGGSYNILLDHMSISWHTDENFTVYTDKNQTEGSYNVTVSNSIVSEGDADSKHPLSQRSPEWGYHSMGPSCINNNTSVRPDTCSFVNNLMAHNSSRNGVIWGGSGEVSNNIVYNWFMFGVGAKTYFTGVEAHLHNNLMKAGPQTTTGAYSNPSCGPAQYKCALALGPSDGYGSASYTTSNNYYVENGGSIADAELIDNPLASTNAAPSFPRATQSTSDIRDMAKQGSDHLRCIGASKPTRDAIDARVIQEFHSGTGDIGIGSNNRAGGHNISIQRTWDVYSGTTTHPVGYDSDEDGMPDDWEIQYGLDPQNPNDHASDLDGDGYTNIEEYLAIAATC